MSDLPMYELEDIAWDELDQIDDHIVPHPSNEHEKEPAGPENCFKTVRHEVIGVSSNAGDSFTSKYVNEKEEGSIQPQKKKRTKSSEKDIWSHSAAGIIPESRDSGLSRETRTVSSDCNTRVPGQCLNSSNISTMDTVFHTDDAIGGEVCAVDDTNTSAYSLSDMTQTENSLSFLDNDREDNELQYGWPDIENFEDVDRMFRNCGSTFGFGSSNEDDLSWLSSSYNIEEPEGILKSDFEPFKSMQEQDPSKVNNSSSLANESNFRSSCISYKSGIQGSECGKADPLGNMNFLNGSPISDRKGEFTPKEQQGMQFNSGVNFNNSNAYQPINGIGQRIKFQKKQATHLNISEGKKKDRNQKKNVASNTFGYLQAPTPYMHLNYTHPSDQISVGSQPSEINSLTSLSPRKSSYASNQVRSLERSHNQPFSTPIMSVEDKLEKLRRRQGVYHSAVSKQVRPSQNEVENRIGVEGAIITNPADKDSSNVPEASCTSSRFDGISTEASSFHQLQQVVEQLDIRTKLCIRDSLYRLARSAEQRHRYANMKGGGQGYGEASDAFMADGSNNEFMDMETDTNPIDRSVAHLLFHRPSDPSIKPAHDGSSLKLHTTIHGSITSPPVKAEQLVCQEEAASEADMKIPITDDG